jgi:mersacidin/lichenicidin family type 2 lantibiotic
MSQSVGYAWKDYEFFETLSDAEKSALPANPAGDVKIGRFDEAAGTVASSTYIQPGASCSTYVSDCCGTYIQPGASCSTFISDCCGG